MRAVDATEATVEDVLVGEAVVETPRHMSGVPPKVGGPDHFSCQIQKFLVGSLATSGKKKMYQTQISHRHKNPQC
jgi:hypothetical protein